MVEITSSVIDKVSSYNIFNHLFPGVVVSCIVNETTRFSVVKGTILEKLFMYYLIGMVVSRIGSTCIEKFLEWLKVKNKKTKNREAYLKREPYDDYIDASKEDPLIETLNETNNTYRTIIAVFITVLIIKLYDWLAYDWLKSILPWGDNLIMIFVGVGLVVLFITSYKKQTSYISGRIRNYKKSKKNLL